MYCLLLFLLLLCCTSTLSYGKSVIQPSYEGTQHDWYFQQKQHIDSGERVHYNKGSSKPNGERLMSGYKLTFVVRHELPLKKFTTCSFPKLPSGGVRPLLKVQIRSGTETYFFFSEAIPMAPRHRVQRGPNPAALGFRSSLVPSIAGSRGSSICCHPRRRRPVRTCL